MTLLLIHIKARTFICSKLIPTYGHPETSYSFLKLIIPFLAAMIANASDGNA